jgi:hypothetical protein
MLRRPLPLAVLLFALAEAVFLIRLPIPHQLVFDEIHYVPAARTLISLAGPANIEHPLLGKSLIAVGMLLFGDTPFGWRFMATLAGSGTVVSMFATTWQITGSEPAWRPDTTSSSASPGFNMAVCLLIEGIAKLCSTAPALNT